MLAGIPVWEPNAAGRATPFANCWLESVNTEGSDRLGAGRCAPVERHSQLN